MCPCLWLLQANTALSVTNFKEAIRVPEALGLDPRAAAVLNTAVTSGPLSLLPGGNPLCTLHTHTHTHTLCIFFKFRSNMQSSLRTGSLSINFTMEDIFKF